MIKRFVSFIKHYALPFALLGLYLVYVLVGLDHLGKFQTADEDLWFANPTEGRIHEYWRAWEHRDWEATRINDKPGVTTAIFAGIFGYPMDTVPENKIEINGAIVDKFHPEYFEYTSFYYQLGVLLFSGAIVFFIAWFAWVITHSRLLALLTAMLLWFSPILLGLSQIVNPDATLWSTATATALGYVAFLIRGKWRYLFLAGIFFGLALLSKYTAAFLFFVLFFATFASFLYLGDTSDKKIFRRYVLKCLSGYAIFVCIALGVFLLLMPAALIDLKYLYDGTFGFKGARGMKEIVQFLGIVYVVFLVDAVLFSSRILSFLVRWFVWSKRVLVLFVGILLLSGVTFTLINWGFDNPFNIEIAPFDAGKEKEYRNIASEWHKLALQIKPIVFTLTPLVLFFSLLCFFLIPFLPDRYLPGKANRDTSLLILLTFGVFIIAFYYAALEQRVLVHVRYGILLYPIASFISAIALTALIRVAYKHHRGIGTALLALILAMSFGSLVADRPFYFNYTNDLLPYDQDVVGAWGYGGYEAAQFLNSLPYSKYATIWADYEGVCPFFHGRCVRGNTIKWYRDGTFLGLDYYVVSRRGLLRNESTWKNMLQLDLVDRNPLWRLYIGDRPGNYVEVYQAQSHYHETRDIK